MLSHRSHFLVALVFVAVTLLAGAPAASQPARPTGAISGVVLGPDGAHLPGVAVTVSRDGTPLTRVVSADHGSYRVSDLQPGSYDVTAELPGFTSQPAPVEVVAARTSALDLRMRLAALSEAVQVIGTAPRDSVEAPRLGESGARDVGEALAGMAGVWKVRRAGIASDVVLRGYQGENVSVLIDGMRLYGACPNNMDHTSFHVDFAEVDRVDVARGPFDLKNQGGLGGAINIVTRRPGPGFHLTPRLAIGSFGYVNPSATMSVGTSRLALLGGYSYRASDAYTDGAGRSLTQVANYKAAASERRAFEVNTAWGRVDVSPSAAHAAHVSYTWQDAGLILYPYLQMDAVYDRANRVNVGYDHNGAHGPVAAVRTQAYYTLVRHWMTDSLRLSSQNMPRDYSMGTMARTETLGGRLEATLTKGTVGFEAYRRGWDTSTQLAMAKYQPQFSIPDVWLTSFGAYGELSQPIGGAFTLDLGARVDRTGSEADATKANTALYMAYHGTGELAATDTYPSGKARLTWRAFEGLTVGGGVGRTVRVPDPQERYFGLRRMGTDWVGNPQLEATVNTGIDVQASYRHPRFYVNASLYRDRLGNFIAIRQQPRLNAVAGIANLTARSWQNVDATMSGAEVEAVVTLSDRLFVTTEISGVRGRQDVTGTAPGSPYIPEIPPVRSRAGLRYDARGERAGAFGEIEVVYSAAQDKVDATLLETPTSPYAVVNLRLGASMGRARLSVGVANLLDRAYVEHLSYQRDPFRSGARVFEPGRNIYTNLAVQF